MSSLSSVTKPDRKGRATWILLDGALSNGRASDTRHFEIDNHFQFEHNQLTKMVAIAPD